MRIRPRLPLAAATPMLQLLPLISLRSWSIGKSTTSRVRSSRLIAALVRCYPITGSPRATLVNCSCVERALSAIFFPLPGRL